MAEQQPLLSPFAIILSLGLAYYVHNDARKMNNPNALWWAVGTFLVWSIVFPVYWYRHIRGRKKGQ